LIVNRARLVASVAFAALTAGMVPLAPHLGVAGIPAAQAQNMGQRNVMGSVVDDTSTPVASATVFLKNLKTKAIRSYTSSSDGRFRFTQVNMADDYDLWAQKDGKKTVTKTVSSWDAHKDFETELKMK
jgi:hypothetical protein